MRQSLALLLLPASFLAVFGFGEEETQASAKRCPVIEDSQVFIQGGETVIGTNQGYAEEGPPRTVRIKSFWIDRHEVTNRQFEAFVRATGHVTQAEREGRSIVFLPPGKGELPVHPSQWWRIVEGADWRHPEGPASDIADRADLPVVHVSYGDAMAYARWKGRALPDEEQFEYAARAGADPSLSQPAPDEANTWQGRFPTENQGQDGHQGLAAVGCFKPNAFGLNDMIGNAWEWTSSWYLPGHGPVAGAGPAPGNPSFDPAQPDARVRVIKGGSFLCAPNYCARYRPEARHAQEETSGASHLGFRTVAAQP